MRKDKLVVLLENFESSNEYEHMYVYYSNVKDELLCAYEYDHEYLKVDQWEHLIYVGEL